VKARGVTLVALMCAALALTGCAGQPPVAPPGPNDQQVASMMQQWAKKETANYQADLALMVNNFGFVRFVKPSEWSKVMNECVRSLGGSRFLYGPGNQASLPALSAPEAKYTYAANAECRIEYPMSSMRSRLRTPEQLDYIYDYYQARLIPCLRSAGFQIGHVPTSDQYRELSENGITAWDPYGSLTRGPSQSAVSITALKARCPALPPGIPPSAG
jgi:hypothetical protein